MLELFQNIFAPPRHLILLVLSIWVGVTLSENRVQRHNISKDLLNNIFFYCFLGYIIGGRFSYVLQNYFAFIKSPFSIFSINLDLFDIWGGIAICIVLLIIFSQRNNVEFWSLLDAYTPFFAIFAIGLGLSNLAAGTAFGLPTDYAWGIPLWNANRHPTQIYQTIASFIIFIWVWFQKGDFPSGIFFLIFTSLSIFMVLLIGAYRADYTIVPNGIKQEQLFAFILLVASFTLIEIRLKNKTT